mmetsp:Transcript_20033/g.68795  ORF Transcript_20033/g.68795 Transcript_20033/m.68795 type:complete len:246 (+) Transcript_20033:507-1244(+)
MRTAAPAAPRPTTGAARWPISGRTFQLGASFASTAPPYRSRRTRSSICGPSAAIARPPSAFPAASTSESAAPTPRCATPWTSGRTARPLFQATSAPRAPAGGAAARETRPTSSRRSSSTLKTSTAASMPRARRRRGSPEPHCTPNDGQGSDAESKSDDDLPDVCVPARRPGAAAGRPGGGDGARTASSTSSARSSTTTSARCLRSGCAGLVRTRRAVGQVARVGQVAPSEVGRLPQKLAEGLPTA